MSQFRVPLDPSRPAIVAVSTILLVLVAAMEASEEGILGDMDPAFLHDFRVAVRRTRAALSELKGIFPKRRIEKFRSEFAWLGEVTGAARDMDVYLMDFPRYRRELPATARKNLNPFRDFLLGRRETEYRRLIGRLQSLRYRRIKESWGRFLRSPRLFDAAPAAGRRAIVKVADRRIWKAYRKVSKEGGAITGASPPEALHELRITCKKLRYLLEFFESLYRRGTMKGLIGSLKGLQDNLGEFQDLHVQGEALQELATAMEKAGSSPAATCVAMGMLVEIKKKREGRVRKEFSARFRAFAGRRNSRLFRELFHGDREGRRVAR